MDKYKVFKWENDSDTGKPCLREFDSSKWFDSKELAVKHLSKMAGKYVIFIFDGEYEVEEKVERVTREVSPTYQ